MSFRSKDFFVTVSASDFVTWHGEGDTDYSSNHFLALALKNLGIPVDPATLYENYFELPMAGYGNVLVYRSQTNENNIFAIDMHRSKYDQLDIVKFGIHAEENESEVRTELRSFFDSAEYQVRYEEGRHLNSVAALLDGSLYPKILGKGEFKQHLVIMYEVDK